MKVIGAGFPKTGTKSLWHAMDILGYKHAESPVWVDHILDDWVDLGILIDNKNYSVQHKI